MNHGLGQSVKALSKAPSKAPLVNTVTGPLSVHELGITLPHEHIFLDISCWWCQPRDHNRSALINVQVAEVDRDLLLADPYHNRDNLILDDADLAAAELGLFSEAGGRTVVDLSTRSIGPYPQKLQDMARRTGLNIISGTGFYVKRAHTDEVTMSSPEELAVQMVKELSQGIGNTEICAGVIGELGTSSPIHPDEAKVLRAAAQAHEITGAPINIHLTIFAEEGNKVLDILENVGVDPHFVALSHLDERIARDYHVSLAKRGCFIEFDCFGSECRFDEDQMREPSDLERVDALLFLLEAGFQKQLLLSQDVCTKMQLRKFGGNGYDHILRSIIPLLKRRGISDAVVNELLVVNPARFLAGKVKAGHA